MNALVLQHTGTHAFEAISLKLVEIMLEMGIRSNVMSIETFAEDQVNDFDLLLVNLGSTAPSDSSLTSEENFSNWPAKAFERIVRHLDSGGSCLILHIAITAFEKDLRWKSLVGGSWNWGVSFHEPFGPATIAIANDPILRDLHSFSTLDEVYECLTIESGVRVLATASERGNAPVVWVREHSDGSRTAYSALGHTPGSYDLESFRALVRAVISWLCETRSKVRL
jgi:type 1 glutamine amidotransferase